MKTDTNAKTSIRMLLLSTRARNCLLANGIETVEHLKKLSSKEITKIEKLGDKSAEEILRIQNDILKTNSVNLKTDYKPKKIDPDEIISSIVIEKLNPKNDKYKIKYQDLQGDVVDDLSIYDLNLTLRTRNSLLAGKITSTSQLISLPYNEVYKLKNMGFASLNNLLNVLESIIVITYPKK